MSAPAFRFSSSSARDVRGCRRRTLYRQAGGSVAKPVLHASACHLPDLMRRRLTLTGSTLRARSVELKTMVRDELDQTVWPYVEGGRSSVSRTAVAMIRPPA